MPAAAHSPATAACGQRPPSPVIALAPLGRSHLDGRHPPHHSCNLPSRASSARQPAAPPCDPARLSNPHRPGARRTVLPSLPAVSSLGGFRTPAASARGKACERPASENLHKSGRHALQQKHRVFDHLVGAGEQGRRQLRGRGLFAVVRLITSSNFFGNSHRQITRLRSLTKFCPRKPPFAASFRASQRRSSSVRRLRHSAADQTWMAAGQPSPIAQSACAH